MPLRLLQMARIPLSIDTPYAAVSPPQLPQRPLQIGEVFLLHPVQVVRENNFQINL
jgi:hypothetical protein